MFLLSNRAESYIEKAIKIITPLIFFMPLLVNSSFYFPFITPRSFLFRLMVTIVFALYLILFVFNREKYRPFGNRVFISYIAFAFLLTLSSFLGGDFLYSFWENAERMEGLIGLYYLIAMFIVLTGVYYRKKSWQFLLYITSFVSFLISYIALSQYLGVDLLLASSGGTRVSGTLGNPTYLAAYALFHMFFAAYLLLKNTHKKLKFELISFYVLDIVLIYLEIRARRAGAEGMLTFIFQNKLLLSVFLLPQIVVNLNFYLHQIKQKISQLSYKFYFALLLLLNFVALFNTQTRGVLVGIFLAVLAIAIFLLFSKYVNKKLKYTVSAILLLFIILVSSLFIFKQSSIVQNNNTLKRVASISLSDTTTETRLLTWKASMQGFKEKPILGWGEAKFNVVFNKYFPTAIFEDLGSRVWFDRPHNVFIQQLIHGGIVALLAYLAIFYFAFKNLFRHYKKTKDVTTISIFGGLIIAYLVQNFFVFDSLNTYILAILLLAITVFLGNDKKDIDSQQRAPSNNKLYLASGLFVLILLSGYYLNVPAAQANKDFVNIFKAIRAENPSDPFDEDLNNQLIDVINSGYLGRFEFRQVYSEQAAHLLQVKEVSAFTKGKTMELAETELLKSTIEQPDNVRHHSFLANLYLAAALFDSSYAQKNIDLVENKALPLSPTRTQLYYTLGSAYMSLNDYDKSIENFSKARELSPDVFESYQNLFSAYLTAGQTEEAKQVLDDMDSAIKPSPANYSHLSQILSYFGLTEDAVAYIEKSIVIYPQETNLFIQLIAYYNRLDDQVKLNEILEKLRLINPNVAEQIDANLNL